MSRWLVRMAPSVLMAFLVALGNGLVEPRSEPLQPRPKAGGNLGAFASPLEAPGLEVCYTLRSFSAQAAALTGSLALVEKEDRPTYAREAAEQIRALASRADDMGGGTPLARVLHDLSQALDAYATGSPAALAAVRDASARNAELRQELRDCSGGRSDED